MNHINYSSAKNETIHKKSIFSSNVYRTNNHQKSPLRANFKANSYTDPEVLFLNDKIFKVKPKDKDVLKECCTQTSKTIIELAQNAPHYDAQNQTSGVFGLTQKQSNKSKSGEPQTSRTYKVPPPSEECKLSPLKESRDNACINFPSHHQESQNNDLLLTVDEKQKNVVITRNRGVSPVRIGLQIEILGNDKLEGINKTKDEKMEDFSEEILPMSPDSLVATTIASNKKPSYPVQNCPYSIASNISEYTLDGSVHEQDYKPRHLEKPLTQIFLEKKYTEEFKSQSAQYMDDYKTQSAQYMDEFKSQSCQYVDDFNNHPHQYAEDLKDQSVQYMSDSKNQSVQYVGDYNNQPIIDGYQHPNYIQEPLETKVSRMYKPKTRVPRKNSKNIDLPDNSFERIKPKPFVPNSSFMHPTKASLNKSQLHEIKSTICLIPPTRRGKSTSPKLSSDRRRFEPSRKVPYIDQSKSDVSSSTTLINTQRNPEVLRMKNLNLSNSDTSLKFTEDVLSIITSINDSNSSFNENTICTAIAKLQETDWRIALRGLAEVVEICRLADVDYVYEYMGVINQRLIELLKSPRSHVCRTACQAAGHLFEYVKDTRRPVFDDIVDILLHKTADANKFIRHDANMALDCMVTHISIFNAVRALCAKGPTHKNPLVRCATARLMVCAVVLAGADFVLNPNTNEQTRKRIILTMAQFLEDKNLETRKLAERLYKVLSKDSRFDVYLRKYLEMDQIAKIKKNLKLIHKK